MESELHKPLKINDLFSRRYIVEVLTIAEEWKEQNPEGEMSSNTALIEEIYSRLHDAPDVLN